MKTSITETQKLESLLWLRIEETQLLKEYCNKNNILLKTLLRHAALEFVKKENATI